ncbi:MAG: GDYXXLXY domain-containing protein [Cyclobacteriaceae bacterium]
MPKKTILLIAFLLVALVQLYVPASMILDREAVLAQGTEYKFRTAPIDPNDPFRGKYITLSFEDTTVPIVNENDWVAGESVYALLTIDEHGFAQIQSVTKEQPADDQDFLSTTVSYVSSNGNRQLTLQYPFNRFYLEESKAPKAERVYWESLRETSQTTYALVAISDGEAVLKDVLINGISVRELADQSKDGND